MAKWLFIFFLLINVTYFAWLQLVDDTRRNSPSVIAEDDVSEEERSLVLLKELE